MARKTKLTEEVINIICQKLKLRVKWKDIAALIGVDPTTIRNWILRGEAIQNGEKRKTQKNALYLELVERIEQAKAELYERCTEGLFSALFDGTTERTEKVITADDGTVTKTVTEKTIPPSVTDRLKVLALIDPGQWQPQQHIKIDYRQPIEALGLNPIDVQQAFFSFLALNKDKIGTGEIVIPEVPGQTV